MFFRTSVNRNLNTSTLILYFKVEVERDLQLLSSVMDLFPEITSKDDGNLLAEANIVLDDLKQLSVELDKRLDVFLLLYNFIFSYPYLYILSLV